MVEAKGQFGRLSVHIVGDSARPALAEAAKVKAMNHLQCVN
jgi:hypothetical protein